MCAAFVGLPKRILIIDDDIDLLMLLERRLDQEGYCVETAASLPEAEEILPSFLPHLILLDINVNGEDGRQLCWKLKYSATAMDVKVIILSGYDLNTRRSLLFGADDLIAKPCQLEFLLHKIQIHLDGKRGTDPLSSKTPKLNKSED
jgi:DNA-binding response OmpR family regulator